MHEKILLVDDEVSVLEGYQRLLHRDFQLETASSGMEALARLQGSGPYAVVVSDQRMPEMDGVQLLAKVKVQSPDTVRIMLTGNSDIDTAVHAVNEGNIFRFLTKPCSKETLARTLNAGLVQYRLATAEKELLEKTLSGSIRVLTEVLSLVNPAAFSRALRVRRYIRHIAAKLSLGAVWRFEIAAMMSQLGCVTLPPDIIEAIHAGQKLSPEDQARFDAHPTVARDLLSNIPRMEPIAWMIAHQRDADPAAKPSANGDLGESIHLGAEILRATLAFDEILARGATKAQAIEELSSHCQGVDPRILRALASLETESDQTEARTCSIEDLAVGMVLNHEIRTHAGMLVAAQGQEVTFPLIVKLKNFCRKRAIGDSAVVLAHRIRMGDAH
jgi:response regulator RpfG family c-di-GMP phosphodiesterase